MWILPKYRWRLQKFQRFVTSRRLRELVSIDICIWPLNVKPARVVCDFMCCYKWYLFFFVVFFLHTFLYVFDINLFIFTSCKGAHSHIRGLGLDDALEPRQVTLVIIICGCLTFFLISQHLMCKGSYVLMYKPVGKPCLPGKTVFVK